MASAGSAGVRFVVQNTFINAVEDADDANELLLRTVSDPTGGRSVPQKMSLLPTAAEEDDEEDSSCSADREAEQEPSPPTSADHPLEWLEPTPPPSPRGAAAGAPEASPSASAPDWSPEWSPVSDAVAAAAPVAWAAEPGMVLGTDGLQLKPPRRRHRGGRGGRGRGGKNKELTLLPVDADAAQPLSLSLTPPARQQQQQRQLSSRSTTASEDSEQSARPASGEAAGGFAHPHAPGMHGAVAGEVGAAVPAGVAGVSYAMVPFAVAAEVGAAAAFPSALVAVVPAGVVPMAAVPAPILCPRLDACLPPLGNLHRFHRETARTGCLSANARQFTKEQFEGRLSVITEDEVHSKGVLRYAAQFTGGELSSADGVGFIFSPQLPCCKNIQRIVSIFANRSGCICVRLHTEVLRSPLKVRPLEIGDWVGVTIDLQEKTAEFCIWPASGGAASRAAFRFGAALETLREKLPNLTLPNCGYFACVVKNCGVTVRLGS